LPLKPKKRFLIDVDDVTAQFRTAYLQTIARLYPSLQVDPASCIEEWDVDKIVPLEKWQKDAIWHEINSPGWCYDMEPMPGAVEAIKILAYNHEVSFVTKPLKTSPTWGYDRRRWIHKHFGPKLADNLHNTAQKYAVDGNYLIEDRIEHCDAWLADRAEHSKRKHAAILYAWPYNEHTPIRHVRMPNWGAIIRYTR
jgi:5'(3')-deoxyribonucleotidase